MLLKQYTTVWTRTGRKMGWVLVYVVKMSFVLWHFDTLTQIERLRLHNTSEISAVSFTYEFMGLWKPLTLLLIHPIWWTRLVLCVYCIYTHTQNHSRWSFTVDFRGGFEPITPIMINICFFFLRMVHDAHFPVSSHRGWCMHDNTASSSLCSFTKYGVFPCVKDFLDQFICLPPFFSTFSLS